MGPKDGKRDHYLGTDVGGTFTDLIFYTEDGNVTCLKVPSTPSAPGQSVLAGVAEFIGSRTLDAPAWRGLRQTHSSTIATNALIERTGAAVGVIVNEGFRDILELGRFSPPDPTRFDSRRPAALAPRRLVREVRGRVDASGREVTPLDEATVLSAVAALLAAGAEVIAVCLLHSYANPAHEEQVRQIVRRAHPHVPVELSSSVWPQAREFERATLTTMNCHVRPVIERYIDALVDGMAKLGVDSDVRITRSNGGMQRAATLRATPIVAVLSGPAAGVSGAAAAAKAAGWPYDEFITFDVGGTSADVGVVRGARALLSTDERVADFPLLIPTVAVSSIGAGGGSILWRDDAGRLKVGPRSVGAVPGPACYGSGSRIPALTDAFLLSGLLDTEHKLGGRIGLDIGAAREALGMLARSLATTTEVVADGAIAIGVAMMAAEVIKALAKHGADAAEFGLVAFGGAGPLVAALVAQEAHIASVLVPPFPGALSAMGAALASAEGDFVEPVYAALDRLDPAEVRDAFQRLSARSDAWLRSEVERAPIEDTAVRITADMRYEGQGYDLNVPLEADWLRSYRPDFVRDAFERVHRSSFGYSNPKGRARIQELRAHAVARMTSPTAVIRAPERHAAPEGEKAIRLWGSVYTAPTYERARVAQGQVIHGPAILTQMDTTTLIPPGWHASVALSGSMILTRDGAGDPAAEARTATAASARRRAASVQAPTGEAR